ncbi:MAG TPA: MBOAT family O-acyltransferase [Bryobacteraceae bacterium]|jgi:D-alanyl-lipoteichoic acid acyltransferase DltB (MBOAT superfamily)|nr:MBOAT family O-acyltransferase [Bryobacteraceae bacterium]
MLPTTPEFFCFLALIFFGYWLLRRVRMAGIGLIVLANYFFYAKWGFIYLALVPAASTIDYLIGGALERSKNPKARRALVSGSIAMNVGLIAFCKYLPFLFGGIEQWTGHKFPAANWTLPLGLSFYGFQAMTYTIDIYRRDVKPIENFWAYLASISFFPTTLAGPITRVAALAPQWEKPKMLSSEEGGRALFLIGLGLMKKFLIADYLGVNLVNRVFDLPTLYSGGDVLVAVYAYAFQLYYDFSGYTDIVIGAGLLLGVRLPINFNRPYIAENIADFWRRWHISLSNWLRDYLYFSMPGKRTKWMPYISLIVTFTIGGIWHGANWTFLVWGLLHGLALAVVRLGQALRHNKKPSAYWPLRVARSVVTFHFVVFAWIFFRAADLHTAAGILAQIASLHFSFDNVTGPFLLVLGIAIGLHLTPKEWYRKLQQVYSTSPALVQAAAMVLLVIAIEYIGATGAAPFIYTKF